MVSLSRLLTHLLPALTATAPHPHVLYRVPRALNSDQWLTIVRGNVIKTRITIGDAVFSSVLLLIKPRAIRGLFFIFFCDYTTERNRMELSVSLACDKKFELRSLCQKRWKVALPSI